MPRLMAACAVHDTSALMLPGATKVPAWKSLWLFLGSTREAMADVRESHSGMYSAMFQVVVLRSTGKAIEWR